MAIEVRKVKHDSDFRQLYNLFVEYEADLPRELRHGTVPDVADLKATYERRNAAFLATSEGDPTGCVALTELDSDTAVVMRLFVKPEGRGLGAARSLVAAAIGFARERRFHRIVLDTNKERLGPAYGLYRSLGFEECDPYAAVTYECPTFMELKI